MFRARDSCGADVRRGRSPKCLFIKATATGNTINGRNDEINKLPEAGHGGASAGRGAAAGQSPRPASKPGPSPASATLPAPQGPAWLQGHPHPTPALAPSPPRDTQLTPQLPRGTAPARPPQGGRFRAPTLSGPLPAKRVTSVPDWEVLGFGGFGGVLVLACQARRGPPACPRLAQGRAPWKWQKAGISPMLTPSQDCLSNSQFQESCVFLG